MKKFQNYIGLKNEKNYRDSSCKISGFEISKQTIKKLIMLLYERVPSVVGMDKSDLDIMVFELPRHCWGLQGEPGDEKQLGYEVSI